jgi:hypothetical protein
VFALLKTAYRNNIDRLFQGSTNTIGKQHFTSLYNPIREKAFTKRNIAAAWAASGLFLLNLDRIFRKTPKPPIDLSFLRVDKIKVGSC